MPEDMITYDWFATAYGWPPDVVDGLSVAAQEWLPVVREARVEAEKLRQAQEQNSRPGR